jgi:hypothetical protein
MSKKMLIRLRNGTWRLVACVGIYFTFAQAGRALAADAPDPAAIFTLQGENSSISASSLTDRYYTNGIRLGYLSPEDAYPGLASLGHAMWGDGRQRISVSLSQQMYTPYDTAAVVPPKGDEPYAGVLLANFGVVQDDASTRSSLSLSLGMVGPAALANQVQDNFHDLIGQGHDAGWNSQLHNEPVIAVDSSRVWRLPTGSLFGLETDALPGLDVTVGTLRIAADAGVNLRIGQGLQSDYGASRIRALSGGDGFKRDGEFGWYVFAGVGGQAVARDITLNGNTFTNSPSVTIVPFVGQAQGGVGIIAFGARLTYTQVVQTQTFQHQKGGAHEFGSLALSIRF